MKSLICLYILVIPCFADIATEWFEDYIETHNKVYNPEERRRAFSILEPKYHFAKQHGYDLTHRSDKNHSEAFNPFAIHNRRRLGQYNSTPSGNHRLGLPLHLDYRTLGFVTSVKKQSSCGACFAFSAVGGIEYWYKKKSGELKDFSVQQWIDCTKPQNFGCDGGLMHHVFHKAMVQPAGPVKFDPYVNHEGKCRHRHERPWLKVKSFVVQSDDTHYPIESHLVHNLVQYGPISIGIDSSNWHFELYKGGILKANKCGKDIDHAVLLVGFTPSYWVVKNSWGENWGNQGYLYLERGKNACGINSYASFITDASI